jgi:hypothetical protein
MMKNRTFLFVLFISMASFSQEVTGDELLEQSIQFHDPNNNWETFHGEFLVAMETPKGTLRKSNIKINLRKQYFSVAASRDSVVTKQVVSKDACRFAINGNTKPSKALKEKYTLNCERAKMFKNYYTYLYGLPMKLKDAGTIINQKVTTKTFKGKEYLVLKVTYSKEVGKDTWYFYFDPKTYAMEVYQFFKEAKNSGEYILLSGLETINGIKMPKNRAWYYNKDAGYLGTDVLSKIK